MIIDYPAQLVRLTGPAPVEKPKRQVGGTTWRLIGPQQARAQCNARVGCRYLPVNDPSGVPVRRRRRMVGKFSPAGGLERTIKSMSFREITEHVGSVAITSLNLITAWISDRWLLLTWFASVGRRLGTDRGFRWRRRSRRRRDAFEHPYLALSTDVFGQKVRLMRLQGSMTQKGLARQAGVSTSILSRVERGQRPTSRNERVAILEGLHICSACKGCPYKE